MLPKFHFAPVLFAALLAACNPSSPVDGPAVSTETAETEPTDDTHGISTDPLAATGFMTENTAPPETAEVRGDLAVARDADGRPYVQALLGQPLPAFTGTMVDGSTFNSEDISRWTLIDVWGIWCGDCMKDSPYVAALSDAIAQDPNLDFISIHTPPNAERADEAYGKFGSVDNYFRAKGYAYPTVLDVDASIRDTLQVAWTPSYFLVAPDGIVRGYRTDLSVAGGEPVKDLLHDIARVRSDYRRQKDDPTPVEDYYRIGPDGTAGLRGPTIFTLPAIKQAFAGLTVTPGTSIRFGERFPTYTITAPESWGTEQDILFTIEPNEVRGMIAYVITTNPLITGPLGERVGETTLDDLPEDARKRCIAGVKEYADTFGCMADETNTFIRIFPVANEDAGEAPVSPILMEMRYKPPKPESGK